MDLQRQPERVEDLQDLLETDGGFAVFEITEEPVGDTREIGQQQLVQTLLFPGIPDRRPEFLHRQTHCRTPRIVRSDIARCCRMDRRCATHSE